jgi:hypothetical protein
VFEITGCKCHLSVTANENGGIMMEKRKILTRGIGLGRSREIGISEIDEDTESHVDDGDRLGALAMRFLEDKEKIEDAIERVEASDISSEDKAHMIAELNEAMDQVQAQYEADVEAEQAKVHETIEGDLDQMDQLMDEFSDQADALREVTMDVAEADTSAAVEAAEAKRQELERMKQEYAEQLRLQMEQAEMLAREMRSRRLGGR